MSEGGHRRIAVNGATGRMGRTVVEAAAEREDLEVTFGVDAAADGDLPVPLYGPDAVASAIADRGADVFVDFSVPSSTLSLAETCAAQNVALVVGTTGFDGTALETIEGHADRIPICKATNFSRGIQALLHALEPALEALPDYDVELAETHHNDKRDAPSGTANTILEAIQARRDLEPVYGREGIQPRSSDEIGVQVSRLGDVRGEHEVRLGGNDEVLTITHRAEDRGVFAAGALDAAAWLAGRNPGWYDFGAVIEDT